MKTHLIVNGHLKALKPNATSTSINIEEVAERLRAKGATVQIINSPPSIKTMMKWSDDGVAKATDGCRVEPDGTCPHGHQSWLIVLGYIWLTYPV